MKRVIVALLGVLLAGLVSAQDSADNIEQGYAILESKDDCAFAQYLFREALKEDADNVRALVGNGRALICQNAFQLGIEELQKARQLDPDNVEAAVELANAYQEQYRGDRETFADRLGEALAILEEAEAIDPQSPAVLNGKGVILYYQGDTAEARTAFEGAINNSSEANSSDVDIAQRYVNLGSAYSELGELELALQAFRRAVTLNPLSAVAHSNVGNTYALLEQCDDAIYELIQATKLNPTAIDIRANMAFTLFNCGSVAESVPHFEEALELSGSLNFPPLYTYLSRAYVEQGNFDEAVRRAQQGALLPPVTAEAFYYLAQAYEARQASGDSARAREAYESALEIDPAYAEAQEALNATP